MLSSSAHKNERKNKDVMNFLLVITVTVSILFLLVFFITPVNAAEDSNTAVIVITDWHAAKGTQRAILNTVDEVNKYHDSVIVCFNGDSETMSTELSFAEDKSIYI